ncbi:RusA family crossover junction endodeoxyribonuclease [Mechercharimyces sp. CAU 1602]|uniref:RusA family crossover junction endodeoxyribonuclease n=1 Tax=Mechercharimyces sp. CAU 1602 TaxID=2973933 RepID=UPI0021621DD2|nr:RusA family crossover junction endodeoxyribonuclease [Mechercharimyces sp. CAU 1602]MCS1351171.1 RusA family crossover junction endodeoxyribonuclease [Mechercharimyces sp. CAU 1602]
MVERYGFQVFKQGKKSRRFVRDGMISFTVVGRPVPAVRMTQRGKWTRPNAKRYLAYKNNVGWAAKGAGVRPTKAPVRVEIRVYLHGKREGDVDNYSKSILDGMNGIAYEDDKQVRRLEIEKVSVISKAEERAEVTVGEVN